MEISNGKSKLLINILANCRLQNMAIYKYSSKKQILIYIFLFPLQHFKKQVWLNTHNTNDIK